jgi:glycerol-3-phosphate acyltransferase PlsY
MPLFSPAAAGGLLLGSYLAGGIPTGYLLVKRWRGADIRTLGSGNPGTANVYRTAGARLGAATLLVDALKGYLPVLAAQRLFPSAPWLALACGAAAVIGHDWTVFLGFRGGKGVATSAGVFLALAPKAMACTAAAFALGLALTGHISVGSMVGALALPVCCWLFKDGGPVTALGAAAGALILYKHIPNMRRLRERKELYLHEKK